MHFSILLKSASGHSVGIQKTERERLEWRKLSCVTVCVRDASATGETKFESIVQCLKQSGNRTDTPLDVVTDLGESIKIVADHDKFVTWVKGLIYTFQPALASITAKWKELVWLAKSSDPRHLTHSYVVS